MPIDTGAVMDLIYTLSDDYNLRVTVKESLKGGLCAGTGAVVGGIVGGPIGIAIGATIGGCAAAYNSYNKFESAVTVIQRMDHSKRERLSRLVIDIVRNLDLTDAAALTSIVMGDPNIQKQIIGTIITFFRDELRMEILD